jgi:hypothetical protein
MRYFSRKNMVGNDWRYEKLCRMIRVMKNVSWNLGTRLKFGVNPV